MDTATPRESVRALDPELRIAKEAAFRGTQTKNATSCGNVCETNILLASPESLRSNGNQHLYVHS